MNRLSFAFLLSFCATIALVLTLKYIWGRHKLNLVSFIKKLQGLAVLEKTIHKEMYYPRKEVIIPKNTPPYYVKKQIIPSKKEVIINSEHERLKYGPVVFQGWYEDSDNTFPFVLPYDDLVILAYCQRYNADYIIGSNDGVRCCSEKVLLKNFKAANGGKGLKYGDKIEGMCISVLSSLLPFNEEQKPDEQTGLFYRSCLEISEKNQPRDRRV